MMDGLYYMIHVGPFPACKVYLLFFSVIDDAKFTLMILLQGAIFYITDRQSQGKWYFWDLNA